MEYLGKEIPCTKCGKLWYCPVDKNRVPILKGKEALCLECYRENNVNES